MVICYVAVENEYNNLNSYGNILYFLTNVINTVILSVIHDDGSETASELFKITMGLLIQASFFWGYCHIYGRHSEVTSR